MIAEETNRQELELLSHHVHEMRKELIALHHEIAATLKLLASLSGGVWTNAGHQGHPPAHCPTCGSALVRHAAMAGDLMICVACGWSQFIDRKAGALDANTPIAAPATAALPDEPWVT